MTTRAQSLPPVEAAQDGPGGGTLIFENDRVRVWDMRFLPGEKTELHNHRLDFMLIQIEGDRIAVDPHPETRHPQTEYAEVDVTPGDFYYLERGGVETASNVGRKLWREICIELKD